MTKLRIAAALLLVTASAGTMGARATENHHETIGFGLAGWSWVDPESGAEHFRMLQTSGPAGEEVLVGYGGSDFYETTCPSGVRGETWIEGEGEGTGRLNVARDLGGATLRGTVDIKVTKRVFCEELTITKRSLPHVPVSFDLTGYGPRRTEAEGGTRHLASGFNTHWRSRATARDAMGTFSIGPKDYPLVFGDFGRVGGRSHHNENLKFSTMLVTRMAGNVLAHATVSGRVDSTGAVWERMTETSYKGVFVGADAPRGEKPTVYVEGYSVEPTSAADGTPGTVETMRYAEGPGTLEISGHNRYAVVKARLDLAVAVSDSSGVTRSWVNQNVRIRARLGSDGSSLHSSDWSVVRIPSVSNEWARVSWLGRSAVGLLRVGGHLYEPTSDGKIGTFRWREHFQTNAK